jgi:YD repeat-containing protein
MHVTSSLRAARPWSFASITRRALNAVPSYVRAALVLVLLGFASADAQTTWDVTKDCKGTSQSKPAGYQSECTFTPVVSDWRYRVSDGWNYGTPTYMDEASAKADYLSHVTNPTTNYCEPPTYVSESEWQISSYAWKPNLNSSQTKSLTVEQSVWNSVDKKCADPSRWGVTLSASRNISCPNTWMWTTDTSANISYCQKVSAPRGRTTCESCGGNPIAVPTGDKIQSEVDYASPASPALVWRRIYRSSGKIYPRGSQNNPYDGLGRYWSHSFERELVPGVNANTPLALGRGDAIIEYFNPGTGSYPHALTPWALATKSRLVASSATGYWYYSTDNTIEVYEQGKLVTIQQSAGPSYTLSYDGNSQLAQVQDHFGRRLVFGYDGSSGTLKSITDPANGVIRYDYSQPLAAGGKEGSYLWKVTHADQTSRQYVMTPAQMTGGPANPHLIYGIVDESGNRYSTYTYDGSYAVATELAGGVNKWTSDGTSLTDPLGTTLRNSYNAVEGMSVLTSVYQPAGSGSASANKSYYYDSNSNVTTMYDFTGNRSCYAYDLTRNLETTRVEGLTPQQTTCATVTPAGASLPAGVRKISTEWHPDWRIAVHEASPRRLTTSVYHGQPDPFAGGAIASCAPADALLPDGKPIAVVCKRVEQATTDANGASGFSATLQAGVPARTWQWTYNRWGQVLTEDGPRTDVADTTSYAYYADTTAEHMLGDLQSITNAAGQVTQFTKYNAHGQLLESVDAKGVTTTHTYDLRLRRTSTSVGGRTTSYSYEPTGDLKRVTQPDGSWIEHSYDDARRLTAVADQAGNRIEYTLDNAGNRLQENIKDPGGALQRSITRSFDGLGRVKQSDERR